MSKESKCPFMAGRMQEVPANNNKWWPKQLNLKILNRNGSTPKSQSDAEYRKAFLALNLNEVKKDITKVLKDSKDWWPADWGHYGPFMVRMAWHSAGTYREADGRGGANSGNLRFAPLNSWPDNGNLDKAKRLIWPVKQKYGHSLSWGDLMILTGNVAMEDMGFKTFGFAGGRVDIYEPEDDVDWGLEDTWLSDNKRYKKDGKRELDGPYSAVQMGLIYVNPEGPGGNGDIMAAANDIRETFAKMAMSDAETVALIAGGHTFGKGHGAGDGDKHVGVEPEGAALELQGFGWMNTHGTGKGGDTITSGLEGAWTVQPAKWDHGYFTNLFKYEWERFKTPAGAEVWRPTDKSAWELVPEAHDASKKTWPIMYTTDLALKTDPSYLKISKEFHENPSAFADAYARAWYKLTHRDMGPVSRCLGPEVAPAQIWQDPIPESSSKASADLNGLKGKLLGAASGADLVKLAWSSAVTFRHTDFRGGANGARIALEPQSSWAVNSDIKATLEAVKKVQQSGSDLSLADMIVLGGCAAIEEAAKKGGSNVNVAFSAGRGDAVQAQTDTHSFQVLEPLSDGFRNYHDGVRCSGKTPEEALVDRAHLLGLSSAEMTALVGGLRVMGGNEGGSKVGVFTDTVGTLNNSWFRNLLDMECEWSKKGDNLYEAKKRSDGSVKWTGSRVDLAFGSNSQLRSLAEYYACDNGVFMKDFAQAFAKVMNNDRYD